jgi:eukaryotic-like serine/threonine-protein kinase
MRLFKKIQAGHYAKQLGSAAAKPDGRLGDVKEQLVSLGPDSIRSVLVSLHATEAREAALEVLERLVSNDTLPIFFDALTSTDPVVVDGVSTVLSRSQNYDPTRLLELFTDPRVSKARLEAILSAQMKGIQPRMLISLLPDLSKDARGVIFRILEKHADSSIVAEAIRLAVHAEWWLRLNMAKLLARFPSEAGIEAVIRMLKDENRGVRLEAVQCLGRLKAKAAIPDLCQCLRDPDIKIQTAAIDALISIGDVSAVPHLVEVLKDESEQARRGAVEVLNQVMTVDAIKDLVSALRDADWWVRVRAADALGTLGGDRVVDAVITLLDDKDEYLRRYAVEILNTVPDTRAVEPLIKALDDADWWVHERAIDALAKTGDVRAVVPIMRLMERETRAIPLCLRALGALGDARAVDAVYRMTQSESAEVRREAVIALTSLSRIELPEMERRMVMEALEASGAARDRDKLRPLEVRKRRSDPDQDPGRSDIESRPSPTGMESPVSPVPAAAPVRDFQNLPPGVRLLDRYRVMRKIGGGGFGTVYLVEDVIVREELVLKVLSPHLALDESMIRRFVQELKYTRRISHHNVIRIYDMVDLGGQHAISMEYFESNDLGRLLKTHGSLPVDRTLKIACQVCEGLAAAHEVSVIHRDIKPANILVGAGDQAKIVDFGLASAGTGAGSRLTKSGILVGTPEYISPEQITGADIDGRADIYSFGVVLYEMLSGRQAFFGENAVNVLFRHVEGQVTPLRELVPDVPENVERFVMSAIAKDPKDRPASALDLLEMLRAAA